LRKRQIRFVAKVFGMTMPIGIVKVSILAWTKKADTERKCPQCSKPLRGDDKKAAVGTVVEHSQEYACPCGFHGSWYGLFPDYVKATGEKIERPRIGPAPKEICEAMIYKYPAERFRERISATAEDDAIIPADETTARNLIKLICANETLGYVIVAKVLDTYEERLIGQTRLGELFFTSTTPLAC
jgi:hypothetical protein